jgi:hypothetical protein
MQFKCKGFYSCRGKIFYVQYFKILTHTEGFSLLYINPYPANVENMVNS